MFWMKAKAKRALEANRLIHDAVVMGIADKYIAEENLETDDFELQLLGRALNWAVPSPKYDFRADLDGVENKGFQQQLEKDEDRIFQKGLAILNADPLIEKLTAFYVAYEVHLIDALYPKDGEKRFPGVKRMRKFLFQTTIEPVVTSLHFKNDYKGLFTKFNEVYGKYGKTLKTETVDSLFSLL